MQNPIAVLLEQKEGWGRVYPVKCRSAAIRLGELFNGVNVDNL
jgi:hypothetical protein